MKKINKFIKLGFFILTIITLTAISTTSTTVHATCLANGSCSDNNNPLNNVFTNAGMSSNSNIDSKPVQQTQPTYHAPQTVQQSQPAYHTPTQNYVAPKPTYSNYVAPEPQPVQQQSNYVAQKTNNVSTDISTSVQNTVDSSNNEDKVRKDAEEKSKLELAQLKNEVVKKINLLPELTTTEKKNYISELNKLDSKEKFNQILTDATNKNKSNLDSRLKKEKLAKQKKEEQERNNTITFWSILCGTILICGTFGFFIYKNKPNSNTK